MLRINEERPTWRAVSVGGATASSLGTIAGGLGPWDMMANYGNSALESNSIDQVEAWCINSSGSIAGISRSMSSFVEPVNKASNDKIPRINCFPGYPISTNRTGIRAALSFALGLIGLSAIPKNFPVAAFLIGSPSAVLTLPLLSFFF